MERGIALLYVLYNGTIILTCLQDKVALDMPT